MSYLLPHLRTGYAVDQAILSEEDRVVVIRFGHDWDPVCMQMDEVLASTAEQMKNFAVTYLVRGSEWSGVEEGGGWVLCWCAAEWKWRAVVLSVCCVCCVCCVGRKSDASASIRSPPAPAARNTRPPHATPPPPPTTTRTPKNQQVDVSEVPDFNTMYELYDPCTIMFFFRNKHIMVDLGTGNNNKINWAMSDKQEFVDVVEVVYRGARKGRGLVVSPKDYSTKYRY